MNDEIDFYEVDEPDALCCICGQLILKPVHWTKAKVTLCEECRGELRNENSRGKPYRSRP